MGQNVALWIHVNLIAPEIWLEWVCNSEKCILAQSLIFPLQRWLQEKTLVPVIALSSSLFLCSLILQTEYKNTESKSCIYQLSTLFKITFLAVTREEVPYYSLVPDVSTKQAGWRGKKGSEKCGSESYVHTSVLVSVGPWPEAPVTVLSCFCWVRQELADPEDALWESEGCSTEIWLWTWFWDWACRGSWHGFLLSSWAAVVAVPWSDPFCKAEEKTSSSGRLTWACWGICYERQTT